VVVPNRVHQMRGQLPPPAAASKGVLLHNPDSRRNDSDDHRRERECDPDRSVVDAMIEPRQQRVTERPAVGDRDHSQSAPPSTVPPATRVTRCRRPLRLTKTE
jgi:hypothetical protein